MARRLGLGLVALCGAAVITFSGCGGDSDSDDVSSESFDSPADSDSEGSDSEDSEDSDTDDEEESPSSLTPQDVADCLDAEGAFVGTIEDDIQDPSSDVPDGLVGVVETFNGDPGSPPAVIVRFFDSEDAADSHFSDQTNSGFESLQGGTLVATPTAGQPDLTDEDLAPVGDCIGA